MGTPSNLISAKAVIISLDKRTYGLTQFHFHQPSEHRLNGKSFAMEVHFVHAIKGAAGLQWSVCL